MKIKVLLVIPGKEVQTVKIPASIKFIKAFIGKELYRIKLNEHTVLIANRNAKLDEFNRFLEGNIILSNLFSILLTMGWIVGITNAINLIDGLDGLSTGISIISCVRCTAMIEDE